ncbi:MAG: hypothetical protein M3R57_05510 [Chloroflexota bacterium]|nr:hypothetical protein [Chloroflexota bacterium]
MTDRTLRAELLLVAVAVAACAGSGGGAGVQPTQQPAPSSDASASRGPGATVPAATGATLTQRWATATLTDVRTGDRFRIADLVASGKVAFLEPMAIWCSKCRAQQGEAVLAFDQLDRTKAVWIGLDVETTESADQLARYSDQNGFDFTYAIADPDLSRALVAEFGDVILNPPATNVIVIGTDGKITHSTGHLSANELVDLAASHGG